MVVEGATILVAISRSWRLTKGRMWRTFAALLVISLAFAAAAGFVSLLIIGIMLGGVGAFQDLSLMPSAVNTFSLAEVFINIITEPLAALGTMGISIASTLLYLDARGRTERLDLTIENWQNGINQGVPAQNMPYPFATPVAAPPTFAAPQAPPAPPASPMQGWQQP